jgi:hypothetical protein
VFLGAGIQPCLVHWERENTSRSFRPSDDVVCASTPRSAGQLTRRFEVLLPHLNGRQQRLALAAEARLLGHGGIRAVADMAGVGATTVRKGVAAMAAPEAA